MYKAQPHLSRILEARPGDQWTDSGLGSTSRSEEGLSDFSEDKKGKSIISSGIGVQDQTSNR